MKTKFVPYRLYVTDPKYKALCAEREAAGVKLMRVYRAGQYPGQTINMGPERMVELETEHLFGTQWNTAPDEFSDNGWRVHNWYEQIVPNESCRVGHYLDITEEMRELLRLTHKCGYCGAQYHGLEHAGKFCDRCLDSEHLKVEDLFLLRLMPLHLDDSFSERSPLTESERADLMPRYIERQTVSNDSRAVKRARETRQKVEDDYAKTIASAKTERDGFIWLLDRHIPTENVIYYNHTGKFAFGWRSPLAEEVKSKLLDVLSEFPFEYEFASKR